MLLSILKILVGVLVLLTVVIVSFGNSKQDNASNDNELDNNPKQVASCSIDDVRNIGISTLSWVDTSAICQIMENQLGSPPSIKLLRSLSTTVTVMNEQGYPGGLSDNAYQFMHVVQSRGQLNSDAAMINTFNMLFKIYDGSKKRVTPKDMNILLSSIGPNANKITDEGLFHLAAAISIQKEDAGQ